MSIKHSILISISIFSLALTSCTGDSAVLSSEPTSFDLDTVAPSCPGLTGASITAGPSISLVWGEASDNLSQASNITYRIFMRRTADNYDLVSPAKIVKGATSTLITNGVSVGNSYALFVMCTDEKGNSYPTGPLNEQIVNVLDSQAPSTINDLSAGSATMSSILLTWSPSDDGVGGTTAANMTYHLYASTTSPVSTAGAQTATITGGQTSYLHTGLNPSTTWYYKVVALDQVSNKSLDSNQASIATLVDNVAPVFSGSTANIVVNTTTTSSIQLSWTAATDNLSSAAQIVYRIYRCTGSTSCDPFGSAHVATTAGGAVTYTDTGLSSSTVYVYGIRAVDTSSNVSTNTDKKITSTTYSNSGSFYAYPTVDDVNMRAGSALAIANVVGTATGATAYPDLLVGSPNSSEAGSPYRYTGCVYVYAGTGVGTFSTTVTDSFCRPSAVANGTNNGANFGTALAIGDFDADGFSDIAVSNPLLGRVYLYRTQNSGGTLSIGTNAIAINHPSLNNTFGTGLCAGNSDNTGADDLFVVTTSESCDTACGGTTGTGNILVFNNTSTAGLFVAPSNVSYRISPTQNIKAAGYNIANNEVVVRACTLGNFDSGNTSQLQLAIGSGTVSYGTGAATDGIVAFFRKTAASTFAFQNVLPTAAPTSTGTNWGSSLTSIQLNTGAHELAVGVPNDSNVGTAAGAVYIYDVGTSAGNFTLTETSDVYYGGSDFDNNAAGSAVAAADIWAHGDGKQDLVIAANLDDNTTIVGASAINNGQVFTYRNNGGSVSPVVQQTDFNYYARRVKTDHLYGTALCRGDVNNDGRDDVIVGAPNTDYDTTALTNNGNSGAVYIYYGVVAGEIDFTNPSQILYPPGSQANAYFGFSCVVMDYNADGQKDLLIGSPYRNISGVTSRGAVYVYYGAANTAVPSGNSNVLNSPAATTNGLFGYALAKGDFDGNGYDDLAVSSIGRTVNSVANSGTIYVYWGTDGSGAITSANMVTIDAPYGASGTANNPYLSKTVTHNASVYFGRVMESFPTVTGSLGQDLIVCTLSADTAANYHFSGSGAATDIGNCYIYEGKVNGAIGGGNYQMMTFPKNEIHYPSGYSNPGNSIYFGAGINKGDWNNDGTQDLIVCASRQQNLDTLENVAGGCFAYYGLSTGGFNQYSGYSPHASGTRYVPNPDDVFYNPNAEPSTASRFGEAVLVFDINNNTSSDLIVGEPYSDNPSGSQNLGADSGRVYILRGGF